MSDVYKHYIRPSTDGIIRYGFCDVQEAPQQGDVLIDDNAPRQFSKPLTNDRQQFIYKLENSAIAFRTQSEIDVEWNSRPPQSPSTEERLAAAEAALLSIMGL